MTELMGEFHFLRPLWLLALLPAIGLLILLWRKQSTGAAWRSVFDQQLLSRLWLEIPGRSTRLPLFLLAAGWLLTIFLLAGPVWERQQQPVWHTQMSRIVILDLSSSMNARDVTPSRLARARFKILDILERSREGRTGLVVFAGESHIVTPLTEDIKTIQNLVSALNTDIMPVSGDDAAPALQMAAELLNLKGVRKGELLLLTDGIADPAAALVQARQLNDHGHILSVLGIGTGTGGAIVRDGATEVARFNPQPLQELARAGGGVFSRLTTDDQDLNRVLPEISLTDDFEPIESEASGIDRWVEHGVWLLPVIVLLAATAFRRGWLLGFMVMFVTPPPANAFGWQDLWLRADQQAYKHLQQGDPQAAAQQFKDPNWRGKALFDAGEFDAAAQAFAESDDIEARYNRGNALARAGDLEQAVAAYRDVLQDNPEHDDAKANLELLEKLLQDQSSSDQSSQQNGEDDQSDHAENDSDNDETDETDGDAGESAAQQDQADKPNDSNENADNQGDSDQGSDQDADDMQPDSEHHDAQQPEQSADQDRNEQAEKQQAAVPDDSANQDFSPPSEEDIALDQWLRQIPEDLSGLLRRKFMLEHQLRKRR